MEFEMKIHNVDSSLSPHMQRHNYRQQQQQQQDEFDKYFARAALGMQVSTEQEEEEMRRASLQPPSHRLSTCSTEQHLLPRRAASCKYPKARRKNSPSPIRGPNTLSPQTAATATGFGRGDDVTSRGSFSSTSPHGDRRRTSSTSGGGGGKFLELKSKSAPHSRSNSWKRSRRSGSSAVGGQSPQHLRYQQLDDGCGRDRRVSVSLEESVCAKLEQLRKLQEDDCYVVRTFATSPEGHLVSRGDSFKRRSASSLVASGTATPGGCQTGEVGTELVVEGAMEGDRTRSLSVHSQGSSTHSSIEVPPLYRVLVLGCHGVGKTALVQQFMTSEFLGAVETSFDDESARTLSVLLDGDETIVELVDVAPEQDYREQGEVAAYVLVYSITETSSFHWCVKQALSIRHDDGNTRAAIILVGNKSDLVRSRQVAEDEARVVGTEHGCKFVEVSAALNHRVDELLVGIVVQVRLNPEKRHRRRSRRILSSDGRSVTLVPAEVTSPGDFIDDDDDVTRSCLVETARSLIGKIFRRDMSAVAKSCENLFAI